MRVLFLVQAGLLALAFAAPLESSYAVKETHTVPSAFVRVGDAPTDGLIKLSIGLKQSRFDELERQLYDVSDPDHPHYGQHLSQEDVNDLIQPSEKSLALVREWLQSYLDLETVEYSPASDFLSFSLSVGEVEELLNTKYSIYQHRDGSQLIRTTEWSLPLHLHEHIVAVQPTTSFLRFSAWSDPSKTSETSEGAALNPLEAHDESLKEESCSDSRVTLNCLRKHYKTLGYVPKAGKKNQIAIAEYLHQLVNRSDAELFLEKFRPEAVAAAHEFKLVSVHGGTVQQAPDTPKQLKSFNGLEGAEDLQTVIGFTWPTMVTAYSTGGSPPFHPNAAYPKDTNEPYLTFLHYLLKQSFIPQVISTSYLDEEETVPKSYAKVVCSHFAQLGARGVSLFFSSGDGGVGSNPFCKVKGKKAFVPGFPAGCPYVTAVGGTQDLPEEVVANLGKYSYHSGGGFSNYFAQPAYQSAAVAGYLDRIGSNNSNLYNKNGRAYPDLAAYSVDFVTVWNGQLYNESGGTSLASPIAASIFSLLNDALISHGRPPMGFLNPWLYKKGKAAFVDVTKGSDYGCGTDGFPATPGWDAASGFGTPRLDKLLEVVGLSSAQLG